MSRRDEVEYGVRLLTQAAMRINLDSSTKAQIFLYLAPHVSCVQVRLYVHGWRQKVDSDLDKTIYWTRELDGTYDETTYKFVANIKRLIRRITKEVYK